jgi:outer membrane protein
MKKFILLIAVGFLLDSGKSFAQPEHHPAVRKGSVLINGNLAVSFGTATSDYKSSYGSSNDDSGYTSWTLSPKVGFFVANGFLMGLGVDLKSETLKYETNDSKATSTQYTLGPIIRYYVPGGFFVHADVSFGKSIEKYSVDHEDAKIVKWEVGSGYAFFVNNHVSIEPNFVYRKYTNTRKEDDIEFKGTLGEFVVGVGIGIFLHNQVQ